MYLNFNILATTYLKPLFQKQSSVSFFVDKHWANAGLTEIRQAKYFPIKNYKYWQIAPFSAKYTMLHATITCKFTFAVMKYTSFSI